MRTSLLLLLTCCALCAPTVARGDAERRRTEELRIVWFGRSGGISNHYGRNYAHRAHREMVGQGISSLRPLGQGPSTFARGGRVLFRVGGLPVADFHRFMAAPPFRRRVLAERWPVADGPFETLFEYPPKAEAPLVQMVLPGGASPIPGLTGVSARLVEFENRRGEVVSGLELPGAGEGELHGDPHGWELRFTYEAEVTPSGGAPRRLFNVGHPQGDGARRVTAIRALVEEGPPTLVLAAGGDLEGFSFIDTGRPDHQRVHSWAAYSRLGLRALVAGGPEADFGLAALGKEAEAASIPVLASNLGGDPLPPGVKPWHLVEVQGVQVLLLGLIEPTLDPRLARRRYEGRPVSSPVEAAREAVEAARRITGLRPDVVVALGVLKPATRAALGEAETGIDLLLTDYADLGELPARQRVELSTPRQSMFRARRPLPVPVAQPGMLRLGLADLTLVSKAGGDLRLVEVRSEALPITGRLVPDPTVMRAVQRTRQEAYALEQRPLLPDVGLDAALWQRLVVEVVREAFDVEAALVPVIPYPWALSGPTSRLQATANLNVPDEVEVVWLTGAALHGLVGHPAFDAMNASGLTRSPEGPRLDGELIVNDTRSRYALATTDSIVSDPRLEALFVDARSARRFVRRGDGRYLAQTWASKEGLPRTLREVVLDRLERLREPEALKARMSPEGLPAPSRWLVDVQDLRLAFSDYAVIGAQDAYSDVRETRVTTRSNVALLTSGALSISRVSSDVRWINQGRFQFAKNTFEDGTEEERADALRFDTELQLPVWALGATRDDAVPYASVGYETEFTPTEGNPLKRRLEGATGLMWTGTELLRQARVAALVATDFGEADPSTELGALGAISLEQPVYGVRWFLDSSLRYYPPAIDGRDTPSELGTWLNVRTGVDFPVTLVGGLMLETFVDVFGYRGKVDETASPGASVLTGVALKFDRVWKPGYEPVF